MSERIRCPECLAHIEPELEVAQMAKAFRRAIDEAETTGQWSGVLDMLRTKLVEPQEAIIRVLAEWLVREDDRAGFTVDEIIQRATEEALPPRPR